MSKEQWRIIVNGEWFYGTEEECIRERAEFESTFTDEDREGGDTYVPERVHTLPADIYTLQATVICQTAEIERLKKIVNFEDAVACVFDNLKFIAANTSNREWDEQLEELAQDVIEFAPRYKKNWKDLTVALGQLSTAEAKNKKLSKVLEKILEDGRYSFDTTLFGEIQEALNQG